MENLPLGTWVKGQCPLNFMPESYPPVTLVLQALISIGQDIDVEVGVGGLSITPSALLMLLIPSSDAYLRDEQLAR